MKKRTVLGLVGIGGFAVSIVAGIVAWNYAPSYIINKIESEHPGVKVGRATLSLEKITLHDVSVTRPKITARLDLVEISTSDTNNIHIIGGDVGVEIDDTKSLSNNSKKNVVVDDVRVMVSYPKHSIRATLKHTSVKAGWIFAKSASVWSDSPPTAGVINITNLSRSPSGVIVIPEAEITPDHELPIGGKIKINDAYVTKQDDIIDIHGYSISVGNNQAKQFHIHIESKDKVSASAKSLVVDHAWVHTSPVTFLGNLSVDLDHDKVVASNGKTQISLDRKTNTFTGAASCDNWVEALPEGLKEPLSGIKYSGNLDFTVMLGKNPSLKIHGICQAACSAPQLQALTKRFTYKVYNSKGERVDRESGPGSAQWAPLPSSTMLPKAFITLEDPNYLEHRGWMVGAFENSLKDNLAKKKFVRGGSTITMQLAKNLWLTRGKTIGRKVQEVLLSNGLESCLNKDQILELYMNVVEFGPDIYGITAAASKYFNSSPYELDPVQSFWLASILPAPRKAGKPDEEALKRTKTLMDLLIKNKRLQDPGTEPISDGSPDPETYHP